ncbi:hypothetical protein VC83_09361 [Pseudogymnoascus destructans]|uniref:DUF7881 domain-containing protein n=1 Tax=Pseudogymnoascus destructans TaxID=655981 RepID=A0A176ZWJ5_9PEZI|nr:uncharacterized protein VC83_09361 [Pseudogymnoascus destructans]OAF54289.1 hypothetical protein VC83_09361 [Pseudogymnoascus destructans]
MSSVASPSSPSKARTPTSTSEDEDRIMPGQNRSVGRTVHLYNSNDTETAIGGLIVTNGVTHTNLYHMVEIILVVTSDFSLRSGDDKIIPKGEAQVKAGKYFVYSTGKIYLLRY